MLADRRAPAEPPAPAGAAAGATPDSGASPTVAEQAFSLVPGPIQDRRPGSQPAAAEPVRPDATEQLLRLASLRDAGVLTEAELAAKTAEPLARI